MAAVEIPMGGDALARSVRRIPRVAIVGVGLVGATTAYALLMSGEVSEIVLIGREPDSSQPDCIPNTSNLRYSGRHSRITAPLDS